MFAQRATQPEGQMPVSLHVNGVEWWFSVTAVTRVRRDLFIQVSLQGPDQCRLTVHVRDQIEFGVTARDILTAACDWLTTRGSATHAYLDLAERRLNWPSSAVA
jgi:hypothetical protein